MQKDINMKDIKKLFSKRSSREIFFESIKVITPNKDHYISFCITSICAIIPAIIIAVSNETVILFVKAIGTLNGTILASFGVVFMGYAFFQALMTDDLVMGLLNSHEKAKIEDTESKSNLQVSNEYFANVMMLDVFAIFVNSFMIITIGSLKGDFSLPINTLFNNIIAFIGICIYFDLMFCIILEMKSFIFNTFQLFNAHTGARVLKILDEDEVENK